MRYRIVLVALAVMCAVAATAAEVAEDGWSLVPVTLEKTGGCTSVIRLVERTTGHTLASCGVDCNRMTANVPAGTWLRIDTRRAVGCRYELTFVDGEKRIEPQPRVGRHPAGMAFQVGPDGTHVIASFTWIPPYQNFHAPFGNHVK